MAYSHLRLRRMLAMARIILGVVFLFLGGHKIASMEFARNEFPDFVWQATHGSAVGFYSDILNSAVWAHTSKYAVVIGFMELFMGVGLLLGLAVRLIAVVGMLYSVNLMLATWMAPGADQPMWRYLDNEAKLIFLFLLFLLLGIGHAGENWGLGSLYHHHRHRTWEASTGAAEEEETPSAPALETFGQYYTDAEEEPAEETWVASKDSPVRRKM